MSRKGFVIQKKDRRWLVLVNPDGTKWTVEGVVPPRRLKKEKRKKTRKASVAATPVASIAATTEVTSQEKLALLSELISMSSGRSAKVLNAIVEDVTSAAKADRLAGVLNRK
jgi:hypothetical protein